MEEVKKPFLSVNQSVEKRLIRNKDIRAKDASCLTDGGWKKLTDLANHGAVWFCQSIISIMSTRMSISESVIEK